MVNISESWLSCPINKLYEVSSFGNIRKLRKNRDLGPGPNLAQNRDSRGYTYVTIRNDKGPCRVKIHKLICTAFYGEPPVGKNDVIHKDGNLWNNEASNLRWGSRKENLQSLCSFGNHSVRRGSSTYNAKLSESQVTEIRAAPRRAGLLDELAAIYGVSRNVIANLRCKTSGSWKHIPFNTI